MKCSLEKASRLPSVSFSIYFAGILWCSLATVTLLIEKFYGYHFNLCLFRGLTGIPCPFCGGRNTFLLIISGHPVSGVMSNPFAAVMMFLLSFMFLFRLISGKKIAVHFTGAGRRILLAAIIAFFVLSWMYTIGISGAR